MELAFSTWADKRMQQALRIYNEQIPYFWKGEYTSASALASVYAHNHFYCSSVSKYRVLQFMGVNTKINQRKIRNIKRCCIITYHRHPHWLQRANTLDWLTCAK